jgi:hypothetical protein
LLVPTAQSRKLTWPDSSRPQYTERWPNRPIDELELGAHRLGTGRAYDGPRHQSDGAGNQFQEDEMPGKSANVKNEKQYEALKDKGMSKERAAKIANAPKSSKHGGEQSGKGGDSTQGGATAQKKKAGRKGGKAAAKKS